MKVFAKFDREGVDNGGLPQISDIQKIYLGISRDAVEPEVHEINSKVGEEVSYEELDVDVICDEEVLEQFDDITLMEEVKRRKLIQMGEVERTIKLLDRALMMKKKSQPANAISDRQVDEVLRLLDDYHRGVHGDDAHELHAKEYIIKHWNG